MAACCLLQPLLSQAGQVLQVLQGQRAYFSSSEFHYSFKQGKGFPGQCTHLSWGLGLMRKPLARGIIRAQADLSMRFKLPKLKDGLLVKGSFIVNLQDKHGSILQSFTYPFWLLSKNGIFSSSETVTYYSTDKEFDLAEIMKSLGLKGEIVDELSEAEPGKLIAWNLSFQQDENLSAELKNYISKGGQVLILGSSEGNLSWGKQGPDEINLSKGAQLNESIKGFDLNSQRVLNGWQVVKNEDEFILQRTDNNTADYVHVFLRQGKGSLTLCNLQLGKIIKHDPSIVLMIRSFISTKEKK